ncbi:hypothetical protein [Hymenobacter coccineus]|uniref:S9 family peptidase n=1 Tax=Hymenobacter coccineus TaxID=1908235 RepID=A0A1G1TI53_9BACT|nr:hypothetical protein [Hymenobacter coccineus]OGX90561.1 hypothetical protein BEN49_06560 [Hymenobacter coccineus]
MDFIWKVVVATGLVLLPTATFAQQSKALVYEKTQVEPDQESSPLGVATDEFKGIHVISASVRGVRGANGVIYWVSKDKATLSAYEGEQLLWRTNVGKAFKADFAQPKIEKLVFASNVIFVSVSKNGFAEVDRKTGQVGSKTVD